MTDKTRRAAGMVVVVGLLAGLAGCDWWPPALQERIGRLEAQVKALEAERIKVLAKVGELTKAVDEHNAQRSQLLQVNGELKAQVDQLQAALDEAQAKLAKMKPAGSGRGRK
ncbi:MAG TPA: hypothetical protein VI337_02715 [Nitrospirales bacterium]|nr:hypothetical protein [Nitrospirales bacterium]